MPPDIRPVQPGDAAEWLRLRLDLWPEGDTEEYRADITTFLRGERLPTLHAVYVYARPSGELGGLIEISIRPYADGCETNDVGYIEGWVVDGDLRGQGIGRALVLAAEAWARDQGCAEMASDAEIDNDVSITAHQRLGYQISGRVVQFCKRL